MTKYHLFTKMSIRSTAFGYDISVHKYMRYTDYRGLPLYQDIRHTTYKNVRASSMRRFYTASNHYIVTERIKTLDIRRAVYMLD